MKSEEYWNDAALRREIAVQTGTNYTGEEILKLYDEALSDIDTEIQKIKINLIIFIFNNFSETPKFFTNFANFDITWRV